MAGRLKKEASGALSVLRKRFQSDIRSKQLLTAIEAYISDLRSKQTELKVESKELRYRTEIAETSSTSVGRECDQLRRDLEVERARMRQSAKDIAGVKAALASLEDDCAMPDIDPSVVPTETHDAGTVLSLLKSIRKQLRFLPVPEAAKSTTPMLLYDPAVILSGRNRNNYVLLGKLVLVLCEMGYPVGFETASMREREVAVGEKLLLEYVAFIKHVIGETRLDTFIHARTTTSHLSDVPSMIVRH